VEAVVVDAIAEAAAAVVDGIAGIAVAMAAVAAGATAGKFFFHPQVSQPMGSGAV
jgi:hypothetical protein